MRRMRRWEILLVGALALLAIAVPGCNLFNDLGNAWGASGMTDPCAGLGAGGGGAGGGGGGGGGANLGGADPGVGGSSVETSGAGAGGSEMGARVAQGNVHRPPRYRPRHRIRSRIGTAYQADCPGMTPDPGLPMMAPKAPLLVKLSTTRLRAIAVANGVGAGHTGIQFNRDVGLAFENWVLVTLGQRVDRWTTPILSPARKNANAGGLPASVIPEYVSDLKLVIMGDNSASALFPLSQFWEVKAVTGMMTPATSQYQILGLIDVAALSPAGMSTIPHHPPPVLVFTTTGNTMLGESMLLNATQRGVAIWQQLVFEDATIPNDPNPDLYIGTLYPMNGEVYGGALATPRDLTDNHSKLTSPTTPPMAVPGDPDPPEVD